MIESNKDKQGSPKILFFSSIHCMPCKPVEDRLNRINISMFGKKLNIEKINVNEKKNREIIQRYKITSVPTIIVGDTKLMVNIDDTDIIDAILQAYVESVEIE
jgi:thiol-disulfide isomerase/thioredoxin